MTLKPNEVPDQLWEAYSVANALYRLGFTDDEIFIIVQPVDNIRVPGHVTTVEIRRGTITPYRIVCSPVGATPETGRKLYKTLHRFFDAVKTYDDAVLQNRYARSVVLRDSVGFTLSLMEHGYQIRPPNSQLN